MLCTQKYSHRIVTDRYLGVFATLGILQVNPSIFKINIHHRSLNSSPLRRPVNRANLTKRAARLFLHPSSVFRSLRISIFVRHSVTSLFSLFSFIFDAGLYPEWRSISFAQ